MKKIILLFILAIFFVPNVFAVDTSYIKSNQNKEDNYLANAVNEHGKILKWDKNIVSVYIEPCDSARQKAILSALSLYNSSFWGILQFRQVKKPENADITIGFSKKIDYKQGISGETAGVTSTSYNTSTGIVEKAKIELLDANWTQSQIKQLTLHEMGHAIGISGHSLNQNDVMYPTTDGRGTLSKRDIETIKMIYKGKTNDVKKTLSSYEEKKYEMNLEVLLRDTKGAPENYRVWANLGDYYYNNKNYNKALESYQTAITKRNAPKSALNKRISNCYLGLGKKSLAEKYLKLSNSSN